MYCCSQADSPWLYVVPWGLRKLLNWIHKRYDAPDIYILENGVDCPDESSWPESGELFCISMLLIGIQQNTLLSMSSQVP